MKKRLLSCLTLLAITGCGNGTAVAEPPLDEPTRSQEASLPAGFNVVNGDSVCPADQYLMPIAEAKSHLKDICMKLGQWDMVRLEGGAALLGLGYGCSLETPFLKPVGESLCVPRPPPPYFKSQGDGVCPANATLMSPQAAVDRHNELCAYLGKWDILRLAGGGSIVGSGYGCVIRTQDTQPMGWSLCEPINTFTFTEVSGDGPCPAGQALVTPQEAQAVQSTLCPTLGKWDILRLSGRGTMRGPGYGCAISTWDPAPVGQALCKSL